MTKIVIGKTEYDSHAFVVTIILGLLVFFELRGGRSYFDEVLCLMSMTYIAVCGIWGKINRYDFISVMLLVAVIIIGVISNIYSGVSVPAFSIIVDIVAETKILWIYYAVTYYIDDRARYSFVKMLTPLAKVYIVVAFICAIISQFLNIGMVEGERYGIKSFRFIFPMSFQFLAVTLIMLAVLVLNEHVKNRKYYYALSCISLMFATKSSPIIFALVFIFLYYYFYKKRELKLRIIIIIAIAIVIVGSFQIQTYLMNQNAPRFLFFYYGGVTANRFFPLGSGFATFGSDQAARIYSPLYYAYGFSNLFGMSVTDRSFLSDTFWPMAIGQFGWIGFIIYSTVYIRIFLSFQKKLAFSPDRKAFIYANFISYVIHAIGSAILSASAGIIGFIALAIVTGRKEEIADLNLKEVSGKNILK